MMTPMFTIAFLLLWVPATNGVLFPTVCVKGVAQWPVVCCPLYKASYCGRALKRGECRPAIISYAEPQPDVTFDDRDNFPVFYFNWTCQCTPRFMGHNCGECAPGWRGDNCDIRHILYRRNILSLSFAEVEAFLATLHYCKSKLDPEYSILRAADRFRIRSYEFIEVSYLDVLAFAHSYATRPLNVNAQEVFFINYAHMSSGFLTWHRHFIFLTERQIQKCIKNENFTLPYYKWEDDPGCIICNDNYIGASGYNGRISRYSVFSEWRVICAMDYAQTVCMTEDCPCERPRLARMPGIDEVYKPTAEDVEYCMSMQYVDTPPYNRSSQNSYRQCSENLHNLVHLFFSGVMGEVSISPNDPAFYLHHCNVDRLADNYYILYSITPDQYPPNDVYGHQPRACITPFYSCVRHKDMMQPSEFLGVGYL